MNIFKKLLLMCSFFLLILQFGGCFLLNEPETGKKAEKNVSDSQAKNQGKENNDAIAAAQAQIDQANSDLRQKESELKKDKLEYEAALSLCERMKSQSIAAKNPNYTDPNSKTGKQCALADSLKQIYEEKIKPFKNEVETANTNLKRLQKPAETTPSSTPIENGDKDFKFSDWLLPFISGLAGLLLIGLMLFFIIRSSKNAQREREAAQQGFKSIITKQSHLRQEVDQLKTTAELLSKQLSEQRGEISALKSQLRGVGGSVAAPSTPAPNSLFASSPPAPKFPVSVENYLAQNGSGASFGKHDPLFNLLKEDMEDGAFYLIRDRALSEDSRYAVPRVKQFVTRDDFVYHYGNYYECADPAGGEVWLKKPAIVKRTNDGWKLDAPGELEVR